MPVKRNLLTILTGAALCIGATSASASAFLNTDALLKDTIQGQPNNELIVPLFIEDDTNQDDYPDKISVKFRVYSAGTTNKHFTTPTKSFVPPAIPCQNPLWVDGETEVEFFGAGDDYTGVGVLFEVECEEQNGQLKEDLASFIYVADTAAAGTAWKKLYHDEDLVSVSIVDWDNDQQDEVKVISAFETNTKEKIRVRFFKKMTGALESNEIYTIVDSP